MDCHLKYALYLRMQMMSQCVMLPLQLLFPNTKSISPVELDHRRTMYSRCFHVQGDLSQ